MSSDQVTATGMLIVNDGDVQLCTTGVAESLPPQCAGDSPRIIGVSNDLGKLEPMGTADGVSWYESVTVVGEKKSGRIVATEPLKQR